tara:strand:- start:1000 stop:1665 length:666 start_codon:yes stop_codon:yes gene_type:complete
MVNFSKEEIKVLIPLRGGSKGIKRKNLKLFNNKPLFTWVTQAAINAKLDVYISTEDIEIKNTSIKLFPNVTIQDRPKELATDTASTEKVISFFLDKFKCKHIMLLQVTSPLTSTDDIISAINLYKKGNFKPLISVCRKHDFIWDQNGYPINYDPLARPRRQDWSGNLVENGAIYIFKANQFKKYGSRCTPPCTLYEMNSEKSFEIDTDLDWLVLEEIIKFL